MDKRHPLTDREKRIIGLVALACVIVLTIWLITVIMMLPNPSQGLV
jgi:type IV secretory pathway component VirB8